jgi:hypothetical protein
MELLIMNQNIDDGGPAFPVPDSHNANGDIQYGHYGMSLRNYIAIQAMQGDWASQSKSTGEWSNETKEEHLATRARVYFRMADAMIKVSKEK